GPVDLRGERVDGDAARQACGQRVRRIGDDDVGLVGDGAVVADPYGTRWIFDGSAGTALRRAGIDGDTAWVYEQEVIRQEPLHVDQRRRRRRELLADEIRKHRFGDDDEVRRICRRAQLLLC